MLKQLAVIDFETYYAPDFSLSKMSTESYIRDERFKAHGAGIKINGKPTVWVTGRLLPQVFAKLDWAGIDMIGHNLHFDGTILNWRYGYTPKRYIDTLGMSRAMLGQHLPRHGLTYAAQALLGEGKTEGLAQTMGIRDLSPEQEQILADYCINDCDKTWGIFLKMHPHFPKTEYFTLDWVTRQFAQPKLLLDTNMLYEYIDEVKDLKAIAIEDIFYHNQFEDKLAYYVHHESETVWRGLSDEDRDETTEQISRDQYLDLRRNGYGADTLTAEQHESARSILASADKYAAALEALNVVPPTKINAKGKVTFAFAKTDEAHKALLEHEDPQVQALVAARIEVKSTIEETRAIKYHEASQRGEWPVDYNYAGAKNTHRLSGGKGGGGNPTNLKRGGTLRKCIHAAEGKRLLVSDLSQIECRMVLWLGSQMPASTGGEAEALEVMRNGGDIYCYFGSIMYGYEINKKDHPLQRQIAKSAVLGLGFGMGAARFMDYCLTMGIKITAIEAESAVALYRNTFKGVVQLWRATNTVMKSAVENNGPDYDADPDRGGVHYPNGIRQLPGVTLTRDPFFGHVALQSYSGLLLKYPDLSWDAEGQGTYRDGNSRVKVFGGKFVENIVQHLARCVLVDMLRLIDPVYPVVMSTYDELVMEIDDDDESERIATEFVTRIMTQEHPEFPGLPLGVETGSAVRYGEAKN
ncbi:MAG: DNA polymerase [Bacteroidota bacterium]